jgi:hypothetical protein
MSNFPNTNYDVARQKFTAGEPYGVSSFEDIITRGYGRLNSYGFWEFPLPMTILVEIQKWQDKGYSVRHKPIRGRTNEGFRFYTTRVIRGDELKNHPDLAWTADPHWSIKVVYAWEIELNDPEIKKDGDYREDELKYLILYDDGVYAILWDGPVELSKDQKHLLEPVNLDKPFG